MKAPLALTCYALFALPLLAACSAVQPVATRPTVVEVPAIRYAPVPAALTTPLAEPPLPPQHCAIEGRAAWCLVDVIAWIESWRARLRQANDDRARVARIGAASAKVTNP